MIERIGRKAVEDVELVGRRDGSHCRLRVHDGPGARLVGIGQIACQTHPDHDRVQEAMALLVSHGLQSSSGHQDVHHSAIAPMRPHILEAHFLVSVGRRVANQGQVFAFLERERPDFFRSVDLDLRLSQIEPLAHHFATVLSKDLHAVVDVDDAPVAALPERVEALNATQALTRKLGAVSFAQCERGVLGNQLHLRRLGALRVG